MKSPIFCFIITILVWNLATAQEKNEKENTNQANKSARYEAVVRIENSSLNPDYRNPWNTARDSGGNGTGWLVGDLNKGMKAMFIMMNGARIFVGSQGLGISEAAYQSALYYTKERLQGKSPDSKNIADPIIVHPEIRKNLLQMKSLNEGIRALMLWTGYHFDLSSSSGISCLRIIDLI